MPITVAYCRNDLRRNDIYITSRSGGRLAPGCSTTVVMDVEVIIYEASGYMEFSWEQIYGPPVTLTYPDPSDLTLALFPYTADGYERKFRFWVNANTGNEYKRAFYDIIVGDNFFESATTYISNDILFKAAERTVIGIKDKYGKYNLYSLSNPVSTNEYSTITSGNTQFSTAEGAYIKYNGLDTNNFLFTFYPDPYINSSYSYNLPTHDVNYMGEVEFINVKNPVPALSGIIETTEFSMLYSVLPQETPILNIIPNDKSVISFTEFFEPNILLTIFPEEVSTINIYNDVYISNITIITEGAGVIDL